MSRAFFASTPGDDHSRFSPTDQYANALSG
jgi:hypothetical protein